MLDGRGKYLLVIQAIAFLFIPVIGRAEEVSIRKNPYQMKYSLKNNNLQEVFEDGEYLYHMGDYERALVLFNEVIQCSNDPALKRRAALANDMLLLLLKSEGSLSKDSAAEFKRAEKIKTRLHREKIDYLYKRAYLYFYDEDYDKARDTFREILALDPQQEEARFYFKIRIPLELRDKKIESLYEEALVYLADREYENAASLFREILVLDSTYEAAKKYVDLKIPRLVKQDKVNSLYVEALAALVDRDYDKAAKLFDEILEQNPGYFEAKRYLYLKIPEKMKEDNINSLCQMALSYFGDGEYQKAEGLFKEIISLDPGNKYANEYLEVKLLPKLKEYKTSAFYQDAIECFNKKQYVESAHLFTQLLGFDPDNADAVEYLEVKIPDSIKKDKMTMLYQDAFLYFASRDYEKCAELFGEILELDPDDTQAMDYLQRKIPQRLKEEQVSLLLKQGIAFFENGEYKNSKSIFTQVIALEPRNAKAKEYLIKIPSASSKPRLKEEEPVQDRRKARQGNIEHLTKKSKHEKLPDADFRNPLLPAAPAYLMVGEQ